MTPRTTSVSFGDIKLARVRKSGTFIAILIINLSLFLLLGSQVIYRLVEDRQTDPIATFKLKPVPPPPKPPAHGGDEAKSLADPTVATVPPPVSLPSMVLSLNSTSFNIKSSVVPTISSALPSLAVPEGSGLGKGTSGGGNPQSNPFGSSLEDSANPGLVGYLYDLKQGRDRRAMGMNTSKFHEILSNFVTSGWDEGMLSTFYKSPKPLNTSYIFIPTIHAVDGPSAFGVQNEVQPKMYVILYKATVSPQQEGTYHFVGMADDILVVRVNGQTVLDGSLSAVDKDLWNSESRYPVLNYRPSNAEQRKGLFKGSAFHVNEHDQVDLEVMIGEEPGGYSNYFLYIQREEDAYPTQSNNSPLLPIFHLDSNPIQPKGEPQSFPPFQANSESW